MTKNLTSNTLQEFLKYKHYFNEEGIEEVNQVEAVLRKLQHYEDFLNHYGQELDVMHDRLIAMKTDLINLAIGTGKIEILKQINNVKLERIKSWQI